MEDPFGMEDAVRQISWPMSEDQSKHRFSHHSMPRFSASRQEQEELKERVRTSVNKWETLKSHLESDRAGGGEAKPEEPHTHGVFLDVHAMKAKVRESLQMADYNVTNYYYDSGMWQYIARNQVFEHVTLGIIGINAVWIAVDTDYNDADILLDAKTPFIVMENFFCLFFFVELAVRFMSFRVKRDALKDVWFVFDSVLVLMMVLETWLLCLIVAVSQQSVSGGMGNASVLRIARLLRLSRMARMARLLRVMPELMIMIKGMIAATRSVFFTLLLQIIIMYVFGIAFTQLLDETDVGSQHFDSVLDSMYTLLMYGTFLDNIGVLTARIGRESPIFAGLFLIFVLMAALTVMNMLIGVLCEVVSAVAATERETMLVSWVRSKIGCIVQELDTNGDSCISRAEFIKILENGNACRALRDVGVDVVGLVDLTDAIFDSPQASNEQLTFTDFMDVILALRGTNNATVKDIVDLRKLVNQMHAQTQQYVCELVDCLAPKAVEGAKKLETPAPTSPRLPSAPTSPRSQAETALLAVAGSLPYQEFVQEVSRFKEQEFVRQEPNFKGYCSEQTKPEVEKADNSRVKEKSINSNPVHSSWLHCHTSATNSILESVPLKSDIDCPVEDEGCPLPIQSAFSTEMLATGWEELPSDPPDASYRDPKGNGSTAYTFIGKANEQVRNLTALADREISFRSQTLHANTDLDTSLQAWGGLVKNQDRQLQDLRRQMSRLGEALSIGMCEFEKIQQNFTRNVFASAQDFSWSSKGAPSQSSRL